MSTAKTRRQIPTKELSEELPKNEEAFPRKKSEKHNEKHGKHQNR